MSFESMPYFHQILKFTIRYKIFLLFFCVLLSVPLIVYIYHFSDAKISKDPNYWGVFGDYLGGTLNPIIGLSNLVVLSYLTYLISRQSIKENKRLFFLKQKITAYSELVGSFKALNSFVRTNSEVSSMIKLLERVPFVEQRSQFYVQEIIKLREVSHVFFDLYITLFTFKVKYGHLFQYDFRNDKFRKLLDEAKNVSDETHSYTQSVLSGNSENVRSDAHPLSDSFLNLLTDFVNQIRKEIE